MSAPLPLTAREQILVTALQNCLKYCESCDTTAVRALVDAGVATPSELEFAEKNGITGKQNREAL